LLSLTKHEIGRNSKEAAVAFLESNLKLVKSQTGRTVNYLLLIVFFCKCMCNALCVVSGSIVHIKVQFLHFFSYQGIVNEETINTLTLSPVYSASN